MDKLGTNIEFETKYKVTSDLFEPFLSAASDAIGSPYQKIKTSGPDIYWAKGDICFRYRFDEYSCEAFLTTKQKPVGAANNIIRTENNIKINGTSMIQIEGMAKLLGFESDFTIHKICDIYANDEVNLVYYSVKNLKTEMIDNFIEIEINEELTKDLTIEGAFAIIEKYENLLKLPGVGPEFRLKQSLYEMYTTMTEKEAK